MNLQTTIEISVLSLLTSRIILDPLWSVIKHKLKKKRLRPLDCPKCTASWATILVGSYQYHNEISMTNIGWITYYSLIAFTLGIILEKLYDLPQHYTRR